MVGSINCGCSGSKKITKQVSEQHQSPGNFPGPPPNGQPPQGMPPGGGMNQFDTSLIAATNSVHTGSFEKKNTILKATEENQSAVVGYNNCKIELSGNQILTSGNTSSNDHSSFQGLNAAVLSRDESSITMNNNYIKTTGLGANGIFAYGKSTVISTNDSIDCTAGGAHGIMCSGGGTIHSKNTYIITHGRNSGAVATDRGSGIITVDGGYIKATGADSPGIYSTGIITSTNVIYEATGAEIAVIEGSNSIICNNCNLTYDYQNKWGVMIYQSFSGDAEGVDGHFELNGGSLRSLDKTGPLFFITNSNANIYLNKVNIDNTSGVLLKANAYRWGHSGSNGGNVTIHASTQELTGIIIADEISSVTLELKDYSIFKGIINKNNKANSINITLDKSSKWELKDDSYVSKIKVDTYDNTITQIIGNGHTVWYKKEDNSYLKGKTYQLVNGGELKPIK